MNIIENFIIQYGAMLIYTILMGIISFIGYRTQFIYNNYVNERIKLEQANIVCRAVNQLYSNLSNEEKLEKAINSLKTILLEKKIEITDLEIRLLIESSVHRLK